MQVQNSSTTAALLRAQASKVTQLNVADDKKMAYQVSNTVSGTTDRNTITGTTGSRLTADTTAELIKRTQDTRKDEPIPALSLATKHHLNEIANNPDYGAEQAGLMGKYPMAIVMTGGVPTNNSSPAETAAFLKKSDMLMAANLDAFAPRKGLYENMKAEGVPPAQIFANLLAFNTTQTDYNTLSDTMQGHPKGYTANMIKAEYTYLQNAIAQGTANKTTG